jgi:uncharacterized protein YlxP (DUF503 family)
VIVGILTLEVFFPYSHSLKDKRRILRGLKDRLRGRYNVALAEVGYQDKWQRALVGIATLNSQAKVVEEILQRILAEAGCMEEAEVVGHEITYA